MRIRSTMFGLLACAALATPALAIDGDRDATPEEQMKVTKALEAKGYKMVDDIEVDDGRFEADAKSPDGKDVELQLDMKTLEIISTDVFPPGLIPKP